MFLLVHILRLSNYKKLRIIYNVDNGSKYINTYIHAKSKVLNISYLLPDNIKDSRYIEIHMIHAIWSVSILHIFKTNKKKRIYVYKDLCIQEYIDTQKVRF